MLPSARAGLTRRGSTVSVVAVAAVVAGRLLGIPELYSVAVVGLVLVGGALAYVRYQPCLVQAQRELRPPQVDTDGISRVELSLRNMDRRRSPLLAARDPFDGGRRWARFHVAPIAPGETVRAAYRLPTTRRGTFPLGPLQIDLLDPFGLAQRTAEGAPEAMLTVFPRIERIGPLPRARGSEPTGLSGRRALAAGGEDLYALRPYQTGDDLRRVHWPATARHDELMIRQDEIPWEGRITVLADLRSTVHSPESFEVALSAAASIVHTGWQDRRQVRLVTTDGDDTGFGSGQNHLAVMFERLAVAHLQSKSAPLAGLLAMIERRGGGGSVAVVSTEQLTAGDLATVNRLGQRLAPVFLVLVERSAWDPGADHQPGRAWPSTATVVRVNAADSFARAWDRAVAGSGPRLATWVTER